MTYIGKTLFITTGGTLCVSLNENKKGLSMKKPYIVDKILKSLFSNSCILEPFSILSEHLTIEHCKSILELLKKHTNYDLVIVLHGTDRLTFSAQYIRRFYKPVCPILFIGCQRSPDMPTYELYPTLKKVIQFVKDIERGIYIVNNKSNELIQLLEPLNCQKLYTFNKNCFIGKVIYQYDTQLRQLYNPQTLKTYDCVQANNDIHILYALPSIQYTIPLNKRRVIVIGTGLGNVDTGISLLATNNPQLKFYICNNLLGPKAKIYGQEWPENLYVSNRLPQLLYIDLLHNISIKNNYGL